MDIEFDNPPLAVGNFIVGGTANSVLYIDSDGKLAENNPGFTYDGNDLALANDGSSDLEFTLSNGTATGIFEVQSNNVVRMGTISNHSFEFVTNNTTRFKVLNSGNVGINQSNAGEKLEVSGNIRLTTDGDVIQFGTAQDYTIQWDGNDAVHTINIGQFRFVGGNVELEDTTDANAGVITKGTSRFIHNFHHPTGGDALPVGENVFVGEGSGNFTVGSTAAATFEGSRNVGVGTSTLNMLTTGYQNMAIGRAALFNCETGHDNLAIGVNALFTLTTGRFCTAVGAATLQNVTGNNNTGVGYGALQRITSGVDNTAVGRRAGWFIANGTTPNQTTNESVYLGNDTKASADGADNEVVIGNDAIGKGTNTAVIGGSAIIGVYLPNDDQKLYFGVAGDVSIDFDGDHMNIKLNETGANELHIGDGGVSHFSAFEPDGTYRMEGDATVFKDINIGAGTLSGPPGLQPAIVNFFDEAGGDTEIATRGLAVGEGLSGNFEMQHDYKEGSDIVFHIHWQGTAAPAGTDKVKFQLTYTMAKKDATLDATTVIVIETDFDTQYEFKMSVFAAITGTDFNIEDQFLFTIERVAASANEYGGRALLATVGIHYELSTIGSRQINTK